MPIQTIRSAAPLVLVVLVASAVACGSAWAAESGAGTRGMRARPLIRTDQIGVRRPAAIAYAGDSDLFLVFPGAAEPAATRGELMTHFHEPAGSIDLPVPLTRGRAAAYDRRGQRLLVLDPMARTIHAIPASATGEFDLAHRVSLAAPRAAALRPVGMTIDPVSGEAFVLDRLMRRILRFTPGSGATAPAYRWIDLGPLATSELVGLALDPRSGHLFTLDPVRRRILELSIDGREMAAYDISSVEFSDPQGLVFAPSSDQTDDPATWSLFVADPGAGAARRGHVIELAWTTITAPSSVEDASIQSTTAATLVRVTATSAYSPPSPDPSGVSYNPATGRLTISDAEVEEMSIYGGKNVFETTLTGSQVRSWTTVSWDIEPCGNTVNTNNRHLYISNDDADRVTDINPGADLLWGTADDTRTTWKTNGFGCGDAEGISYDPVGNRVFIADGVNEEVYIVNPGTNGVFNGGGDDVISHFDTHVLGVTDPETVEWKASTGTLFLLASSGSKIVREVTTTGALVASTDVSFAPLKKPAGLAYAPSSNGSGMSFYIVNRGVDNDSDSRENDGTLVEISIGGSPPANTAPVVSAGPDRTITLPAQASLDGTVTDDGLPSPPALTTLWTKVSGPGTVTFANPNAVDTQAGFSAAGTYVLQLSASDGQLSASDPMQVTVQQAAGNTAPVVNAGPDRTITLPAQASLDGTVTDDGLPSPPALTTLWTKVSGPGTVTFANPNAVDTQAGFSATGVYVLRLSASDGQLSANDPVQVTVVPLGTPVTFRVANGLDDVEESAGGSVYNNSTDLELVFDGSNQTVGLRFVNVAIPKDATITTATIQFQADEAQSESTTVVLKGQASGNAPAFTTTKLDVSGRARTSASVTWTPPAWNTVGEAGAAQRTPDLKDILQEIVRRSDWVSGNSIVILITGTGHRTAEAFEGLPAAAPLLQVQFQ